VLIAARIHPHYITVSSLFFGIIAFFLYFYGYFFMAAVFCFLSGILDTFDGEVARQLKLVSKVGAFLDSTIDRVNEFLMYMGMFCFYIKHQPSVTYWVLVAIFGSLMVSYTRARAEGIGISPQIGVFERFTRLVFIIAGSVFGPGIMAYSLMILAVGTVGTMIHRIIYVLLHRDTGV
jgi:CDP-diacylglycerol--glycerol-3-phosphate 3-phosphatidyltransferase